MSLTQGGFNSILLGRGNGLGTYRKLDKKDLDRLEIERLAVHARATATEYFVGQTVNSIYGVVKIIKKYEFRGIWNYDLQILDKKSTVITSRDCRNINYVIITK